MKYIIILLLFCSCNPLRHYQKVVNDPFRNEAERELLARASLQEFPTTKDTPTVRVEIDSTAYMELNNQYLKLVEDYVRHVESDTTRKEVDTLFLTKIRALRPATITKTIVREIPVADTRKENQLQTKLNACSNENEALVIQAKAAREDQKRTRTTNVWLYIVGGLLLGGNILQLTSKRKLLT